MLTIKHKAVFVFLLGIALPSLAGLTVIRNLVERQAASIFWNGQSLVIYSLYPNASVSLQSQDSKVFTLGRLSKSGSLAIENLQPDNYILKLSATNSDGSTNKYLKPVQIKAGKCEVIGFPQKIVFSKE
jgi:hypothetical protein